MRAGNLSKFVKGRPRLGQRSVVPDNLVSIIHIFIKKVSLKKLFLHLSNLLNQSL